MLLHEDLKMVYRMFVGNGEGCSICDSCRFSCGGLRHGGNVLWARTVGDGVSFPSFLPMSTIEVFAHSGGDYIAYQELSIACLAVHLTEGYLQGP